MFNTLPEHLIVFLVNLTVKLENMFKLITTATEILFLILVKPVLKDVMHAPTLTIVLVVIKVII